MYVLGTLSYHKLLLNRFDCEFGVEIAYALLLYQFDSNSEQRNFT